MFSKHYAPYTKKTHKSCLSAYELSQRAKEYAYRDDNGGCATIDFAALDPVIAARLLSTVIKQLNIY